MSILDVYCRNSIVFTNNDYCEGEVNICVGKLDGYCYWSTLFFELSQIPNNIYLNEATIILFKIPISVGQCCYYGEKGNKYEMAPLINYASPYTYRYHELHTEELLKQTFEVTPQSAYTEIDITNIVKSWLNEELENKGLLLTGDKSSKLIVYGSELDSNLALRPFLRIKYEKGHLPYPNVLEPSIELPSTVKIIHG